MPLPAVATRTVHVTAVDVLDGTQLEAAWWLYQSAFAELNALTIQRHLMYRAEFDDVAADVRIRKYVAHADGELVGLATYTNLLDAMPLISPAYFARRWPDLYRANRVFYCGFVAVDRSARGAGVFVALVEAMYRTAEQAGGVISLDVCRFNDETHRLSQAIGLLLHRISDGRVVTETGADCQSFNIYDTRGAGG